MRFGEEALSYDELSAAAAAVAAGLAGVRRAALLAVPSLQTCVACVGALAAGVALVPISPDSGEQELAHMLADSRPEALLAPGDAELPEAMRELPRVAARTAGGGRGELRDNSGPEQTAAILYTSGTTGPPKGVQIPRRAIATNLDAIFDVWQWTAADRLAHALPLFHVHGLILGVVGALRRGGSFEHLGRFSPDAVTAGLARGATMLFGVPTMYHRLAVAAQDDQRLREGLREARLLVSGSAPLPPTVHRRIEQLTGQRIVERYGMTETMMNCAMRADGDRAPGYVGPPVPGVEVRLVDEDGAQLEIDDDETFGDLQIKGPNLFTGYLNRERDTAAAMDGDWFRTGDIATRRRSGEYRIVGRRSTDLIKSAGYRIGAGEIETSLLDHPDVSEVAVAGVADEDLGQRVVAWVVLRDGAEPDADVLIAHVGRALSPHKRPRAVRFVSELPRNAMGKVVKTRLPGV